MTEKILEDTLHHCANNQKKLTGLKEDPSFTEHRSICVCLELIVLQEISWGFLFNRNL